jgi:hypothetical protein
MSEQLSLFLSRLGGKSAKISHTVNSLPSTIADLHNSLPSPAKFVRLNIFLSEL